MTKIPIACTLNAGEQVDRSGEWKEMLARSSTRTMTDEGARLVFPRDATLASELADLVAREVDCCGFFTFTLTVTHDDIVLGVHAPPEARELVAGFAGDA